MDKLLKLYAALAKFDEDDRAQSGNLVSLVIGIAVAVIVGVGVAIPITNDVLASSNITGLTATIVGFDVAFARASAMRSRSERSVSSSSCSRRPAPRRRCGPGRAGFPCRASSASPRRR